MRLELIISISLLAAISLAAAYTPEQQVAIDGARLSYQIGQAYERISLQGGDVSGFNALVDQWNAWVAKNFGQDANLLMQHMTGPANLQQPYLSSNNTTANGVVHAIDGGSGKYGPSYVTNDVNLLPDAAIAKYHAQDQAAGGAHVGDGYLGGV
jgi:hypothetical protein